MIIKFESCFLKEKQNERTDTYAHRGILFLGVTSIYLFSRKHIWQCLDACKYMCIIDVQEGQWTQVHVQFKNTDYNYSNFQSLREEYVHYKIWFTFRFLNIVNFEPH